jgi:phenolic acid decarboxylase
MAIDQGNVTTTANKVDRGWRVEIFIADDDTVQLRFHREIRAKDTTSGQILARDRTTISAVDRTQSQIAAKSYTAGGVTATGQQILQLLNRMSDTERQFDIDNPPPGGP